MGIDYLLWELCNTS